MLVPANRIWKYKSYSFVKNLNCNTFKWPVRIYYEDTDSGGVVYYANYLKFMERARTEWLRDYGIEQDDLRDRFGIIFAVRQVKIDYLLPAKFNDQVVVTAEVNKKGKASITFKQTIERDTRDNKELLAKAEIKIACLDANAFKPAAIPEVILEKITGE